MNIQRNDCDTSPRSFAQALVYLNLRVVGVPDDVIESLFHSAERYAEMWQRAEDAARTVPAGG